VNIGVAGFGIAGGAAAYLLAKQGHSVTIFEQSPSIGPVGAGILLQPSGQFVLHRLGLLDSVIKHAEPIDEIHALKQNGATLVRLRYADMGAGGRAHGVHRGVLFDTIRTALTPFNPTVRLGCQIVGSRMAGTGVVAIDSRGEEYEPFDFLIAADGSRSALRGASSLVRSDREYDYGALWAVGRCCSVHGRLHQVVHGTRHLLGLLPMGDDQCTLFWSVPVNDLDALRSRGIASWREDVLALCPLAEELLASVASFDQTTLTTYRHVSMRRWNEDRVVFLGDAAHAMSPHLGQGVNLALMDAEAFANAIAATSNFQRAAERYETLRRPHVNYYAAVTRLLSPFFQHRGWLLGAGRDIAIPAMVRVPPVRRTMARTMAGVKTGWVNGALTDRLPPPP